MALAAGTLAGPRSAVALGCVGDSGSCRSGSGFSSPIVYLMFSEAGGVQRTLWDVVLSGWRGMAQGEALDIGTGQGALAVRLALKLA